MNAVVRLNELLECVARGILTNAEIVDCLRSVIAELESEWMELPKDADGERIAPCDEVQNAYHEYDVVAVGNGTFCGYAQDDSGGQLVLRVASTHRRK